MSDQDLRIVPVDQGSAPLAVAMLLRFFADEGFHGTRASVDANFKAMLADPHHWAALATIDGGEAVGVVTTTTMLYVEWGRLGEIGDLYVCPDHRGKGVAKQLVTAATEWCKNRGCSAVSVVVTPEGQSAYGLLSLYERLGFSLTGRHMLVYDATNSK